MTCRKVDFDSEGIRCTGYLYLPECLPLPSFATLPCVVLGAGFGGTQDTPSLQTAALAFAQAGMAAFTFDYRHFGESAGQPRQVLTIQGQIADFRAAIRAVRNLPEIDSQKIAIWGTSLGGGHVVCVAALEPGLAAAIAQIPFNGFPRRVEGASPRTVGRLLAAMVKDVWRGWRGREPAYIPSVGKRGELAVIVSDQAHDLITTMQGASWRNEVAPRVLFEMMRYKPSDQAECVTVPFLLCVAEHDKEAPAESARQIARAAPFAKLLSYPVTHFDFYRPEIRQQVLGDQICFLHKHLAKP